MPLDLSLVWAIEPVTFDLLLSGANARGMKFSDDEEQDPMEVKDGVAIISVVGALTKERSWFTSATGGYSTSEIRQAVEKAASDDNIKSILLKVDSPGGTVDGTADLADAVLAARASKKVVAQVSGMAASAAYWIASQADTVFAHRTDSVGSIGTRMMMYDYHRLFEQVGIEAVPVDTGKFKSAGAMGTEITQEQRDYFQEYVNAMNAEFLAGVASGRNIPMDDVKSAADGRVFVAKEAKRMGLIDGVQTYQRTLADMRKSSGRPKQQREAKAMSDVNEPVAATCEQIEQACPGASSDFVLSQLKARATIAQAQGAFIKAQADEIAKAKAEAKAAADEAAAAKAKPGVDPVKETKSKSNEDDSDPVSEFNARVDAKVKAGMPKAKAIASVVRESPDMHAAYVEAINANRRGRRAG